MILNRIITGKGSTLKNGLIELWELDETSGTVAYNSVSSHHGTINGAASIGQTGKLGQCIYFDGANDYVNFGNIANFGANADFTVSFWTNSMNSYSPNFFNKRDLTSPNVGFFVYYENREIYTDNTGEETDFSPVFVIDAGSSYLKICAGKNAIGYYDNNWHLIIAFREGTTMGISVDGNTPRTYTNANVSANITSSANFYLGRNHASNYYNGKLDQLALWSRRLTNDEIATLYNSGNGLSYQNF